MKITYQNQNRLGEEKVNKYGDLMKIVKYNNAHDITIEFQDKYHAQVHTQYHIFKDLSVKNPYMPSVFSVGIPGNKYPTHIDANHNTKEYETWHSMLKRCYNCIEKKRRPTYKEVTVCKEWLLYDNFYEWLHSQENFDKWVLLSKSALDKDILIKGNKIYSSDTCCLVPQSVNSLFIKQELHRGDCPIGVYYNKQNNTYIAQCNINYSPKIQEYLGSYPTPEDAFYLGYKPYKEKIIKKVAEEEYNKNNITKKCYEAMINYQVEITD